MDAACQHAGIAESAHYRAIENGELAQDKHDNGRKLTRRESEYREYREQVLRARARVAVLHVALVTKAAQGGSLIKETTYRNEDGQLVTEREYARPEWQASKFMLQASFRDEFARQSTRRQVELSGPGGGPVEVARTEEVLHTLAERLSEVAERHARELPGGWDAEAEDEPLDYAEVVGGEHGGDA